jgi:hypothetical protein
MKSRIEHDGNRKKLDRYASRGVLSAKTPAKTTAFFRSRSIAGHPSKSSFRFSAGHVLMGLAAALALVPEVAPVATAHFSTWT